MRIKIKEGQYQDLFLLSECKFPALIGGVGTGKTLCLLLKIYKYCEDYPQSSALIVRKEFTDLKDSTIKDFENYFTCKVGVDKNYRLPNGSVIMFRHADEIEVLKNINLGIAGIEQAEEFENDTQFQFIRDRLRQNNGAKVRPLCIIANAQGHNWIWKTWVNQAQEVKEIDSPTGQFVYKREEYEAYTANSFANAENLVPDFIADLRRKQTDAPNHYKQYVLNSFEETNEDDFVFNFQELLASKALNFISKPGFTHRLMGFDIARFGNDKCAAYGLQQVGSLKWTEFHMEQWDHRDLDYTTGRILSIHAQHSIDDSIIDEDGMGAGPIDFIVKGRQRTDFQGFRNKQYSYDDNKFYGNPRTEAAFKLKDLVSKNHICIKSEEAIQELMTLRYRFMADGRRILISKDEMRKEGIKSPNVADALLMAASLIGTVQKTQENIYQRIPPQRSREGNLFQIAGVR